MKVIWKLREWVAREIKYLKRVGKVKDLTGKLRQTAGYQLKLLGTLVFPYPQLLNRLYWHVVDI